MKNFFKKLINKIQNLFNSHVPEFDFPVQMETSQTGAELYVEKGRYAIKIYEGELAFYEANGWHKIK